MELKSSYVFLERHKSTGLTKDNDGCYSLDLPTSITFYIKQFFPSITDLRTEIFPTKRELTLNLDISNKPCQITFLIYCVQDATYVNVIINAKTKAQAIKCLEEIQSRLLSPEINKEYLSIISYDAISKYYCDKIYPKLNDLERNLRHLLFNTYIVNFGRDYFSDVDKDLQNKIKTNIQAKGSNSKKEDIRLQQFFYSFEFTDVQKLLFTPRWTETDEIHKQKFLDKHNDLTQLTDEELRSAFKSFTPKSDWEKFFSTKIVDIDVKQILEEIRHYRNSIAHCKFLNKESYLSCKNAINKINSSVITAIKITEEDDFTNKNIVALNSILSELQVMWRTFVQDVFKPMADIVKAIISPKFKEWQELKPKQELLDKSTQEKDEPINIDDSLETNGEIPD